jgi:hypothetical protein
MLPNHPPPISPELPRLEPQRFSAETRERLSAPGLRTFLALADLWGLTEAERLAVLGQPARSTFQAWAKKVREHDDKLVLSVDQLTRLSLVLGIHSALQILFLTEAQGVAWLRRPHAATVFGGKPPLDLIVDGSQDSLFTVRRYLDAQRGGMGTAPNAIDRDFKPYTKNDIVEVP